MSSDDQFGPYFYFSHKGCKFSVEHSTNALKATKATKAKIHGNFGGKATFSSSFKFSSRGQARGREQITFGSFSNLSTNETHQIF